MRSLAGRAVHFMGLVSDGGVHSHQNHLYALVEMAARRGAERVWVHAFLDGRDTPPESGLGYVEQLEARLAAIGTGAVATVMGRYYAMDRDNRWDRVEKAWQALVLGEGVPAESATAAIAASYEAGVTDEFVVPAVVQPARVDSGRHGRLLQLPPGPRARDHAGLHRPDVRGLRPTGVPAGPLRVPHRIRSDHPGRGRLPQDAA